MRRKILSFRYADMQDVYRLARACHCKASNCKHRRARKIAEQIYNLKLELYPELRRLSGYAGRNSETTN